jgi:DNA primase
VAGFLGVYDQKMEGHMGSRSNGKKTNGEERKDWVDFQAVKAAVTMQMVLDHYGINGLKAVGADLRGPCPIHRGSASSKQLSINLRKNAFKCFYVGCEARGNVLDFVAAMEHCSVRDAALKLRDWFKVGESAPSAGESEQAEETATEVQRGIYEDESGGLYEVVATAAKLDDLEQLIVFRELFDEFHYWVAAPQTFDQTENTEGPRQARRFTLVKAL